MSNTRLATAGDLDPLLELFEQSEVSDHASPTERAREIWAITLRQIGVFVFVSDEASRVVATCMLITAPNLLRKGCKPGFLENVVTHPNYQRRGQGSSVVQVALERACVEDCFHIMLQSGRKDAGAHLFYEGCGFKVGQRTAYVARRPMLR